MKSFDLTVSPWIPCEKLDGSVVELSTFDVLSQAHQLKALATTAPTETAALYRHLLAVLHRSCDGPQTMEHWSDIARAGHFEATPIGDYLGRVRDRMDLCHPTHPFAQTRGLVDQFTVDPIDQLGLERSSWGSARSLFQHRPLDYAASMSPAEAARALLQHHAFATGGLVKKPKEPTSATAAPLLRAAVVVLRGPTLFATLVSNLLVYDPREKSPIPGDDKDEPSWEQEPLPSQLRVKKEPKRTPRGWLDLLTWLSRRLELVWDGDRVTGFVRAVGQGLSDTAPRDPMVTYRIDDKRGLVSLGFNPERAFWRNANALFEASDRSDKQFLPPKTVDQVSTLKAKEVLGHATRYRIDLYGVSAEKSRVDQARREHLVAPLRRFGDPDARENVRDVLAIAEEAVAALRKALWSYARFSLSPGERDPDRADISSLVRGTGAEEAAWSDLGEAFESFLRRLDEDDLSPAVGEFRARAVKVAESRFKDATSGAQSSGGALKARALADQTLRRALAPLRNTADTAADDPAPTEETPA